MELGDGTLAALVGLSGGLLLGLAARLGRFCTLGAIEDVFYGGSDLRLRMWGIAIGTAVLGTYMLAWTGLFDPRLSIYLDRQWNPLAAVLGGLVFGYGMAMAGNCGYGALARLGGGDLRSFVIVLVMGLAAYVALSGPLAPLRIALFARPVNEGTAQALPHLVSAWTGFAIPLIGCATGLAILVGSALPRRVHRDATTMISGLAVGLAVVSGWWGTAWVFETGWDGLPVRSHSFAAPLGETMIYAMTASGNTLSFGIGSVTGVLAGAFIGSLMKGHFRWEACEDPRELKRQLIGAAMMGVGAAIAGGCSVGQGLSAMSLLSLAAPLTLASIVAGAVLGLRHLIAGFALAE